MPANWDTLLTLLVALFGVAAVAGGFYWTIGLARILIALRAFPTADAGAALAPPAGEPDAVCVVVPAHNERHAIGALIESLRAQTYPRLSFVLALDRCTDDTEAVARAAIGADPRFTILPILACPEGWAGKAHAAWRSAQDVSAARDADLLLFADADTTFHPECVNSCVRLLHDRSLGLLSLLSTLSATRWYERVAQPVATLELMRQYPLVSANRWPKPRAFANGQFMLFTREAYVACGGHEAVKSHLLEDIALARHVARAGFRTGVLRAGDMLHCCMYEDWSAFQRGWKRIFMEAANRRSSRLASAASRHWWSFFAAPVAGALALAFGGAHLMFDRSWFGGLVALVGLGSLVAYLTSMMVALRAQRTPLWCAALTPIGGLLVVRILRAASSDLRKGRAASWAGLTYLRADRDHPDDPGASNL